MPKINVLEKQVAELIAAGEVVERPASIVKELVENAVDAGASAVTVEIQGGGIRYIRVADNGGGIERADVRNAFLRHATSKVKVADDLSNIMTMGFRGEALASIAAMSRVELLTRTRGEQAGTLYAVTGGEEEKLCDAGCPVGTTITVRDVFFNTPARMKFLKKDVSEGNSVAAVVEKAALGNPTVAFKLIRDGEQRIQTPGDGKLISAVRCVLGREFAENCIPVDYAVQGLCLTGLISKPSLARGSRTLQNFFINSRFVHSKTCMAALEESYRGTLMVGKFPSCVLNLQVPPQTVDVNVHPAKIEVRFSNEKSIFDLCYYGCKTALGAHQEASALVAEELHAYNPFATQLEKTPPVQQRLSAQAYRELAGQPEKTARPQGVLLESAYQMASVPKKAPAYASWALDVTPPPEKAVAFSVESVNPVDALYGEADALPLGGLRESAPVQQAQQPPEPQPSGCDPYENARVVGELFGTYVVLENGSELLLVDKHAAHERLLFNRLAAGGIGEERQVLLTPVSVQLSPEEHAAVLENLALLEQAGITAEDFGDGYLLLREVAPVLSDVDLPGVVTEFAGKLLRGGSHVLPKQLEALYHTIACRAAIKAGDRTSLPSLEQLIQLLREDGDAGHCPHGRPVAIRITKYEIEKKFGRLG